MALKIKPKIYIDGKSYTSSLVFPIKYSDLLDEQLDEAKITLKHCTRKTPFSPLTPVLIRIENTLFFSSSTFETVNREPLMRYYVVSEDDVEENPVGSELYTHELSLLEETAVTETYIADSLTFTNDLGRTYTE